MIPALKEGHYRPVARAFAINLAASAVIVGTALYIVASALSSAKVELKDTLALLAGQWASAAVAAPSFANLLGGDEPTAEDVAYFRTIANVGDILRFTLLRPDGTVIMTSGSRDVPYRGVDDEDVPGWSGTSVLFKRDTTLGRDVLFARVLSPLVQDVRQIGRLDMTLDATDTYRVLRTQARDAIIAGALLLVVAAVNTALTAYLLTRQRRSTERIVHLAHHDPLTGLANRNRFQATLERAIAGTRRADGLLALHMVDLDGFKAVNDSLGHDAGDELLKVVAARITDCVREGDLVARLGGDEFAVIQREVSEPSAAMALAARMNASIRAVRELNDVPVSITLSIGVALAPEHTDVASELQKSADAALYRAKRNGRNQHVLFEDGMDCELKTRNTMRVMIRRALELDGFELHYQPQHEAKTGRLIGFEALLRLRDGDGGHIPPARFIPVAEDMGLTPAIGQWVLGEACATAARWTEPLSVSVNLSAQQFCEDLVAVVADALERSGLDPRRLELEITESLFISDPEAVEMQLRRLRALGTRIVMDDFGTGYSSLSYLWKFPFDKLKVDRSCFRSLSESERVAEVLRTISAMSGAMNLRVVAEGIETEAQRTFARDSGYDELQGFLCGRPMAIDKVAAYIEGARPPSSTASLLSLDVALAS
ncbi:putative bifunctional diguanylate cyclase/phosphodiesterase [Acuticoccus sp.]|uniref:putative bifunctional diguanylate cyclase/phosphodiesterase n=1 Tax=Acuticoccus sp. TaxID=1904378 RepID=UPI003B5261BC